MNGITSLHLTADEQRWTPDECAWQFLRSSERYEKAFSIAAAKHSPQPAAESAITSYLSLPSDASITVADREICMREFGLAAFVDPKRTSLPPLTSNGSWFHPLVRPNHTYYLDKEIAPRDPRANRWIPLPTSRHLMRLETPFGFLLQKSGQPDVALRRTANVEWITDEDGHRKRKVHYDPIPHHEFLVSAAVDCSVPPDGQMSAFAQWANALRKDLQLSTRTTSHTQAWRVDPVEAWTAFSGVDLGQTRRKALDTHDTNSSWRVVSVDVLGSLTTQIENCEKVLREVYRQHAIGWIDRFPRFMPGMVDSRTAGRARPSYMKLLIKLAHHPGLASWDGDDDSIVVSEIARDLGLNKGHHRFDFELGPHLRKAQELVNGDYRILIHGQVNSLPKL